MGVLRAVPRAWRPLALGAGAIAMTLSLVSAPSPADAAPTDRSSARVVSFAGYDWEVRRSQGPEGPGPNCFSDGADQVSVDSRGRLHLWIRKVGNQWCSAEVTNLNPTVRGYGTYRWTVASRLDRIDLNAVLGLFTWDSTAAPDFYREIDIEVARWSRPTDPTNAQFVIQPHGRDRNLKRIRLPEKRAGLRLSFTWAPDSLTFRAPDVGIRWVYRGPDIPKPGAERVHVNLWQNRGLAPSDREAVRVVLADFTFTPRRG